MFPHAVGKMQNTGRAGGGNHIGSGGVDVGDFAIQNPAV